MFVLEEFLRDFSRTFGFVVIFSPFFRIFSHNSAYFSSNLVILPPVLVILADFLGIY